jgi:hypothetical protein
MIQAASLAGVTWSSWRATPVRSSLALTVTVCPRRGVREHGDGAERECEDAQLLVEEHDAEGEAVDLAGGGCGDRRAGADADPEEEPARDRRDPVR